MTDAGVSIVAIDTGGTFTDVVCRRAHDVRVLKVPSTPADPAAAVLAGIAAALGDDHAGFVLIHGSTVATNALLERRGARVLLIQNEGFTDIIEIGRQNRPQLYALVGTRPPPLVPRDLRIGVRGRIGPQGDVLEPLDARELDALAARVRASGAGAVAICLLHSYANGEHERAVACALDRAGVPVSVSSELLPEFREYERTATTVVNAYVAPVMDRYLARIEEASRASRIRIMGSAGGAIPLPRARREAVHTVLSGPAGGVTGALAIARRNGLDNILSFDMGGTSTDVSLCPGRAVHTREFAIAGVPLAVPVLDIHTVGAGGGSIARVDAGGALRVGPESAGADPGPICYGRGGTRITVTDANVWLGRLPPAGWHHQLDEPRAGSAPAAARPPGLDRSAIEGPLRDLASAMGTGPDSAAEGVITVVNAAMEGALRVISVERGYDPVDFTLVPFGGAAGLHASALADRLGIPRVLIPPDPGVLSAWGMLVAPIRKAAARTVLVSEAEAGGLDEAFAALASTVLQAMEEEGIPAESIEVHRRIDARYRGQSFELTVPADAWVETFHRAHHARYGYDRRDGVVEAVTLRVEAEAAGAVVEGAGIADAATSTAPVSGRVSVYADGKAIEATCHVREELRAGHVIAGPCIVLEYSSTLWLPEGWTAHTLSDGSLLAGRVSG